MLERLVSPLALVELERAGLIVTRARGDRSVVHGGNALIGPGRLAAMSPLRRRLVAQRVLAALPPPSDPGDTVQRAKLHLDAGVPAPRRLLLAASSLLRLSDPALARRFAEANHRWNADTRTLADLLDHHVEAGHGDRARDLLADVEQAAVTPGDRVRALEAAIAVALFVDRDPAQARAMVTAARSSASADLEAELTSLEAMVELLAARPHVAARLAGHVRACDDPPATAALRAGVTHVACRMLQGRTTEALREAERLLPYAETEAGEMPTAAGTATRRARRSPGCGAAS